MSPRFVWIMKFVAGKSMLDLGCVRHNIKETEKSGWLHGEIRKVARKVVGVDYLQQPILELRQREYEVVCADVKVMELQERFDAIVLGDLIEYLNNFGKFIERTKEHINPEVALLLTAPQYYLNWKWMIFLPINYYLLVMLRVRFTETICMAFKWKKLPINQEAEI